jgi:hypothetical protein
MQCAMLNGNKSIWKVFKISDECGGDVKKQTLNPFVPEDGLVTV